MSLKPSIAIAKRKRFFYSLGAALLVFLIALGIFASNGWLPKTDPMTGNKFGWFGEALPKNATSTWNPFAPPPPGPTTLSKENIYAGSRLLAVEDANASAIPPADIAVWRPTTGAWLIKGASGSQAVNITWGQSGDQPIPADFDGDGKTDLSVYRSSIGSWQIQKSSGGDPIIVSFGAPCEAEGKKCEFAVPADFDGDGKSDYVVFEPSDRMWNIIYSSGLPQSQFQFGDANDRPYPADFDGDGKADYSVWRASTGRFYSRDSSNPTNFRTVYLGQTGDKALPADYDGDGKADHAVWRPSTGDWHIRQSSDNQLLPPFNHGQSSDIPVQNDYDGDGKCDKAVFRIENGGYAVWYLKQSANNPTDRIVNWGISGDIPVPALYRR